jgi:hypothetical protein
LRVTNWTPLVWFASAGYAHSDDDTRVEPGEFAPALARK